MFVVENLNFEEIFDIDPVPSPGLPYISFMKDVRTDFYTQEYTGTFGNNNSVSMDTDILIRTVSLPPYSKELTEFIQYPFNPVGTIKLFNAIRVLNYNNLKLHKTQKYVINMFTLTGEFVTDITAVWEDGTNNKDLYFEILEQLTTDTASNVCLWVFKIYDVSSPNTLELGCKGLSGADFNIRFNIND